MDLSHSFGFWKEFYSNTYKRPSIFNDIKNTLIYEEKDKILLYLKSGLPIVGGRGTVFCPIHSNAINSGSEVYVDGLWFWTGEAIHYIENHDIAIPASLLAHMKKHQFICTKIDEKDDTIWTFLYEKSFNLL